MTFELRAWAAAICALASLANGTPALSQSSPLIIDQQRVDHAPPGAPSPPPGSNLAPAPATPSTTRPAPGLFVRAVQVEGATASPARIRAASRPFIGRPLDPATLDGIAQAISQAYSGSDIALHTVVIPNQDFSAGLVRVRVIEGYVEQVTLSGAAGDQGQVNRYAARLTRERPLRRSTLERYLSLIRDIPGLTVDPKLLRGDRDGAVRLRLDLKRKPFGVSFALDDRGTAYLGRTQISMEADFNGLIRQGDQTRLIAAAPTDFQQFRYASLSHSEPIGSNGLTAMGQVGTLETRPRNSPVRGHVVTGSAQMSYPLIRGFSENLYLAGELDLLNSDNGAFGAVISSEHTRVARLTASYGRTTARRSLSAALGISQGLDGLGARVDPRQGDAGFTKVTAQAGWDQQLASSLVLRLRGTSQLAGARLPASESFALGGGQYGRAFPAAYVLGDSGIAGSAELAWRPTAIPKLIAGSELYGFADGGEAAARARPTAAAADLTLASAGVGLRLAVSPAMVLAVEGAKALRSPYPESKEPWKLVVGWRAAY